MLSSTSSHNTSMSADTQVEGNVEFCTLGMFILGMLSLHCHCRINRTYAHR
jgi:hypothetical protein